MKFKILLGKKSTKTWFGLIGCSHGANYGGYDNYRYGIKGIISIGIYQGWGYFKESTDAFN